MKDKANKFFVDAINKLNLASAELNRPEEDVVTYSVCKNSQLAIENYLKGYLLQNSIEASNYKSIDILFDQCVKVNENFKKVNLSDLRCQSHKIDSTYCNEVSRVINCHSIADKLDAFLREEKIIG